MKTQNEENHVASLADSFAPAVAPNGSVNLNPNPASRAVATAVESVASVGAVTPEVAVVIRSLLDQLEVALSGFPVLEKETRRRRRIGTFGDAGFATDISHLATQNAGSVPAVSTAEALGEQGDLKAELVRSALRCETLLARVTDAAIVVGSEHNRRLSAAYASLKVFSRGAGPELKAQIAAAGRRFRDRRKKKVVAPVAAETPAKPVGKDTPPPVSG